MLPQPEPNAPAPPPSEAALRSQRWWNRIVVIGMSSILILVVIGFGMPLLLTSTKKGDRAEAVSHAKQIGLALFEFREKHGRFPDDSTIHLVKQDATDPGIRLESRTSNDFFRQLFAAQMIDLETPFYAKTRTSHRPDNRIIGPLLLEKGEVAFAYVVSHASCEEGDVPILIAPLVKGKLLGDPKTFDGKAVVYHADASVHIMTVRKDGSVPGPNHKDFFDPSQPYWHGIPPKVAWPE